MENIVKREPCIYTYAYTIYMIYDTYICILHVHTFDIERAHNIYYPVARKGRNIVES